jgi:hypothetical protein
VEGMQRGSTGLFPFGKRSKNHDFDFSEHWQMGQESCVSSLQEFLREFDWDDAFLKSVHFESPSFVDDDNIVAPDSIGDLSTCHQI